MINIINIYYAIIPFHQNCTSRHRRGSCARVAWPSVARAGGLEGHIARRECNIGQHGGLLKMGQDAVRQRR